MNIHKKCNLAFIIIPLILVGCTTIEPPITPTVPEEKITVFPHDSFNLVLQRFVNELGQVDYSALKKDPHDLDLYYQLVAAYSPDSHPDMFPTDNHKLAYWINAYNAFAIQGILQGYSPSSLFGRFGFFLSNNFNLGGAEIDLYDLEHKILIPQKEPRIHFAINCASVSCPALRSQAYVATDLDRQLEDSARRFINDPSRNRFDRKNKIAYLSRIFDWFEDDFSRHSGSVLAYVAHYVDNAELAQELSNRDYTIEYLEYDWNLNGISPES